MVLHMRAYSSEKCVSVRALSKILSMSPTSVCCSVILTSSMILLVRRSKLSGVILLRMPWKDFCLFSSSGLSPVERPTTYLFSVWCRAGKFAEGPRMGGMGAMGFFSHLSGSPRACRPLPPGPPRPRSMPPIRPPMPPMRGPSPKPAPGILPRPQSLLSMPMPPLLILPMPPRGVGAGRAMPERISVSNTTKSRGVSNRISANSSALTGGRSVQ
mmetsp:Transcript_14010/g.37844  ORF Transcript_14010/g.37844 Transcript_14010/m.37844 type:complete len:214 (+) Transcript_14010:2207-2848(+)